MKVRYPHAGILLVLAMIVLPVDAQDHFWVFLENKDGVEFDPYSYFDPASVERRQKLGLPVFEYSDLPVRNDYLTKVKSLARRTGYASRWMNAVFVEASEKQLRKIAELDFVSGILPSSGSKYFQSAGRRASCSGHAFDPGLMELQTGKFNGSLFRENNITGKGVRIAVFDGGFPGVDIHPAFEHIRSNGRIIKTWDFVRGKENVYAHVSHGTMVLSCIAGMTDGTGMGLAPDAEFLLAITEKRSEPFSEEENWLAAMEWADRNGAMIINSSLGYTHHRYFTFDMDGNTSLVARAAKIAARKGMLVVNAMGNDGQKKWKILNTPADADSVLSVGGINPFSGYHILFSSFGPTADGRRKPNVSAPAHAVVAKKKDFASSFGTSFSTPLVTGFAACVWQIHPGYTNMMVFDAIERSAHLYPYYDYAHGYGIPQAGAFFGRDTLCSGKVFSLEAANGLVRVHLTDSSYTRTAPADDYYLYFHIENPDNKLLRYGLVNVTDQIAFSMPVEDIPDGGILRIWYRGEIGCFRKTTD